MQYKLTNQQARRFMLLKNGLIGKNRFKGKEGILKYIKQAGCIQFDPIDVCGKNPELVLQSRIQGFQKDILYELLYEDRRLIDYFDKNMAIHLTEDWKYFSRRRESFRHQTKNVEKVRQISQTVKKIIKENGFAASKDIDFNERVDWYWSETTLSRAALETLYFTGDLVVHHKQGAIKHYALAEDCIPQSVLSQKDPNGTWEEYHAWHVLRRIGALGLLWNKPSDAWLGILNFKAAERKAAFERLLEENRITGIEVEGIGNLLYCWTEDISLIEQVLSNDDFKVRTELIAPLDNMMWDRKLIQALFDFDYKWEIYTPVAQRKYGYYVLPVLSGDRLIGRAEIVADRKSATLIVRNIWLEDGIKRTAALRKELRSCIKRFAKFNTCSSVEYERFI